MCSAEQEMINALVEETPLDERANQFKKSGNAAFGLAKKGDQKRFSHALIYYSQALGVGSENKSTNAAIYSNRALVHLAMKNYRNCIQDCMQSINLVPTNIKPYFRAAQASLALDKFKQSLNFIAMGRQACKHHLLVEDELKAFTVLEAQVVKAKKRREIEESIAAAKREKEQKSKNEKAEKTSLALKVRNITMGEALMDTSGWAAYESDIYVDENRHLHWPVLLLYEEVMQSDFIRDFHELTTFKDNLSEMFPPKNDFAPWDTDKKYTLKNLRLYYETGSEEKGDVKRVEVSLTSTLASVLNNRSPGFVVPSIPTFFVLTKSNNPKDLKKGKKKR